MGNRMTGVVVASALMISGAAMAQTAGHSVEPPSRGIVPVTGPSTVSAVPEAANPGVVPAVGQGEVTNPEGARKGSAGSRPAATATRSSSRSVKGVKQVPKPVAKTTVKKTSVSKHVAKGAEPQKGKHVAAAKHQAPAHHATVGKPIPVTKRQPPAKGTAPVEPVLPRV